MSDPFTRYEQGVEHLLEKLGKAHPRYTDACTLQTRLLENLEQTRLYGDNETRRSDRAQILDALNRLSLQALGSSFNELVPQVAGEILPPPRMEPVIEAQDRLGLPLVFLCHAKEDKELVRRLYGDLKAVGLRPWLDEEDLLPGQDWELEIRRAIREAEFFLACLSSSALDRRGYLHKEIRMGLDVLDEVPEGQVYLIPVRFEECSVPERLRVRQWVDLFPSWEQGIEKILQALESQGVALREPLEPEMVLIPAGEFLMGSDPERDKNAWENELPQHILYLPDYYIARTPVTYAQYAAFVRATSHRPPWHWEEGNIPGGKEEHPVNEVSWYDAMAYCRWLSEKTGKVYRLPSEADWEKAARGWSGGRKYPWGDTWDSKKCNSREAGPADTTPVGAYPEGASPHGLLDMAGNVWELTSSLYKRYPYRVRARRKDARTPGERVMRGGSFYDRLRYMRCACRRTFSDSTRARNIGFRVVLVPPAAVSGR